MPHPLNRSIVLVRGVQLIKGYPSLYLYLCCTIAKHWGNHDFHSQHSNFQKEREVKPSIKMYKIVIVSDECGDVCRCLQFASFCFSIFGAANSTVST